MQHLFTRWGGEVERAVTLVDVPSQLTIADAAEILYSENPLHLAYTDILIVRRGVSPPCVEDISDNAQSALSPFWAERAPNASVHLLYLVDYEIKLTRNCNPGASVTALEEAEYKDFIEYLRDEELKKFINESSALFHSQDSFIYRSPSGAYCNAFLRVGNVQMGKYQLDAFAFWLMPLLKDVDAIITDTWSISSIMLNAVRKLHQHDPTITKLPDVDMLSCYQDGTPDVSRATNEILIQISHNSQNQVLFILSTVMTGASLEKLRREIRELGLGDEKFEFIALYKLNTQCEVSCLCNLSDGFEGEAFNSFKRPPDNVNVVEIDPHTYFPLHIEEALVELGKSPEVKPRIDEAKEFIDAYQGCRVLSVHRNATDLNKQKLRHHAIYIDVSEMLAVRRFKERLEKVILRYDVIPKAIITPPHEAGLALAKEVESLLKRKFSVSPRLFVHSDLLPSDSVEAVEYFKSCNDDDAVIILDDVSATGIRLSRYQTHLRDCYKGRIDYIVGVARPESLAAWERRVRDLRYRADKKKEEWHRIDALETYILPNWAEKDCPWCQELELLEQIAQSHSGQLTASVLKFINERRRMLVNAQSAAGITSDAFWCIAEVRKPTLTDNSIFLANNKPTDADVYSAVASVVQHFRKTKKAGLHFSYPYLSIITPMDYLGNTFSDVILRFAIIRSAKRNELKCWKDKMESDRRVQVEDLLLGKTVDPDDLEPLRLEFALAIAGKKLPEVFLDQQQWQSMGNSPSVSLLKYLHGQERNEQEI